MFMEWVTKKIRYKYSSFGEKSNNRYEHSSDCSLLGFHSLRRCSREEWATRKQFLEKHMNIRLLSVPCTWQHHQCQRIKVRLQLLWTNSSDLREEGKLRFHCLHLQLHQREFAHSYCENQQNEIPPTFWFAELGCGKSRVGHKMWTFLELVAQCKTWRIQTLQVVRMHFYDWKRSLGNWMILNRFQSDKKLFLVFIILFPQYAASVLQTFAFIIYNVTLVREKSKFFEF